MFSKMDMNIKYTFNDKIKYRDTGNVLMAFNEENSDMYEFNSIGGEIFRMITEEKQLDEILKLLLKKYNGSEEQIKKDFEDIINRFIDLNIMIIK